MKSTGVKLHSKITHTNRWAFCGPGPHMWLAEYPLVSPGSTDYRWPCFYACNKGTEVLLIKS